MEHFCLFAKFVLLERMIFQPGPAPSRRGGAWMEGGAGGLKKNKNKTKGK